MSKLIQFPGGSQEPRLPTVQLTEAELERLLIDGMDSDIAAVQEAIPDDIAGQAPIIPRVAGLLRAIDEKDGAKLTDMGYMPRAIVLSLARNEYAATIPSFVRVNREADSMDLLYERTLCELAGLIENDDRRLQVSELGRELYSQQQWGEMYFFLLKAALVNTGLLAEFDGIEDEGTTLGTIPLLLHMCRGAVEKPFYPMNLAGILFDLFPTENPSETAESSAAIQVMFVQELERNIRLRLLERFAYRFGLLECAEGSPDPHQQGAGSLLRRSLPWRHGPLFPHAFAWNIPAPQGFPPGRGYTAYDMLQQAEELLQIPNGMAQHEARGLLQAAREIDPQNPSVYLLLTRLESDTTKALELLETGIAAAAELEAEVPDDTSPWRDHLYRDVLRMQMLYGELLKENKRWQDAEGVYRRLLQQLPEDEIGATLPLFEVLAANGRLQEAAELNEQRLQGLPAAQAWNRVLLAHAEGGASAAAPLLSAAREANPLVPEAMITRSWQDAPAESIDDLQDELQDEADHYVFNTRRAWTAHQSARQWVIKPYKKSRQG